MNVKRKLVLNTIFVSIPRALSWILTLFVTPYIVGKLGISLFGVWSLLFSLSLYFFLADFGFASAIARFVAEADATRDDERLSRIVSVALWFYAALSLAILALALAWKAEIFALLQLQPLRDASLDFAYAATIFGCAFSLLAMAFSQVLEGLQKMNVSGSINSIGILAMNLANVVALHLGYGIEGLATVFATSHLLTLAATLVAIRNSLPALRLARFDGALFKAMLRYGGQLHVSMLAFILVVRTESPIISSVLGATAVGYYRLANGLAGLARDLPSLLVGALLPTATMLHARERQEDLMRLYERANAYLAFFAFSIGAFFFCFADALLRLWLNSDDFQLAATPMRLMVMGFCANVLTGVSIFLARAIGLTKQELVVNLVVIFSHLPLNVALLRFLGESGIGVATALALAPSSLVLIALLSKRFGWSFSELTKKIFLPNLSLAAFSSLVGLGVYALVQRWLSDLDWNLRQAELTKLLFAGLAFSATQFVLGARFGIIRFEDLRDLLKRRPS